jgi:integrase
MVNLNGQRIKLVEGPEDEKHRQLAEEKFVELRKLSQRTPDSVNLRVADLVEAFLRHSRRNLAPDTHRINRYYAQLFAERCGPVLVADFKPYHVSAWIEYMQSPERVASKPGNRDWGETTVYNARKLASRVFSWAKNEGFVSTNPLAGLKRIKPTARRRALTPQEYGAMHAASHQAFANLLLALWETGARPFELRNLRWEQVREDRWVLAKHKTAGKTGKERVIYPSAAVRALVESLRGNGSDYVFLNTEGRPWTMNAVRLQVSRLRENLGLADDVSAYLLRHGFGTRAILNGINPATVAELMGHSSLDMVSKVYVHLAGEHAHLKEAVDKINPAPTPDSTGPGPVRKRSGPASRSDSSTQSE